MTDLAQPLVATTPLTRLNPPSPRSGHTSIENLLANKRLQHWGLEECWARSTKRAKRGDLLVNDEATVIELTAERTGTEDTMMAASAFRLDTLDTTSARATMGRIPVPLQPGMETTIHRAVSRSAATSKARAVRSADPHLRHRPPNLPTLFLPQRMSAERRR